MSDQETPEVEEEVIAYSDMTATQLQAAHQSIIDGVRALTEKPQSELTGPEIAQKRQAKEALAEIKGEFAARTEEIVIELDDELTIPEAAPAAEVTEAAPVAEVEAPVVEDGPQPINDEEKELAMASQAAHEQAENDGSESAPVIDQAALVQPLRRASTGEAINIGGGVERAGVDGAGEDDWRFQIAKDYKAARKEGGEVWRSERRSADTPVLEMGTSALRAADIMGLNRADSCNPRYINDTISCVTTDDAAQEWIPKFAMTDEVEVRTKRTQDPTAPTFFEWAYEEDFSGTAKTGLVVAGDVPAIYDAATEATWKPVTALTTDCLEDTHRLRSVGYIREISRGQDLADPAQVERGIAQDTAFLAQAKAEAVIAAFDADAVATSNVHTFDGVTGSPFSNPMAAVSYLFGEANIPTEKVNGVSVSDSTLFVPRNIAALMGVARYETIADNTAYTLDVLGQITGAGDVVLTYGIVATGGLVPTTAVPAAIDPVALGRTRVIPMYRAWRDNWRQGQGPGVAGAVTADEKNLRGNKRLYMVEDDLVNIPMGCLATQKFTLTLDIVGGHVAGS